MKRLFVVFNKDVIVELENDTFFWGLYVDSTDLRIFHYVDSGVYEVGHKNDKLDSRDIIFKDRINKPRRR